MGTVKARRVAKMSGGSVLNGAPSFGRAAFRFSGAFGRCRDAPSRWVGRGVGVVGALSGALNLAWLAKTARSPAPGRGSDPQLPRSGFKPPNPMSPNSFNWHQRTTWGMTLGLIAALGLLLTLQPGVFGSLAASFEYDTLDFWFALRDTRQSSQVGIVAIDEATLRRWNGGFRARDLARVVRLLRGAGARDVALDLPQLCDARLRFDGQEELAAAMRANGRVTLPLAVRPLEVTAPLDGAGAGDGPHRGVSETPSPLTPSPPALSLLTRSRLASQKFALPASDGETFASPARELTASEEPAVLDAPSALLLDAAAGAGHLDFALDRFGRARRLPLYVRVGGRDYPALAAATARVAGITLPAASAEPLLLSFPYGGDEEDAPPFPIVSLAAALERPALLEALRGRAVVIGATAPGLAARFPTPSGTRICATELQAIALDNLMTGQPLRRAPEIWHWLFSIMPGIIVGGFAASRRPAWSGPVALLCVLTVALASLGFFWQDIWLDTSVPWLTIALTFLIGVIGRARRQERESTHIASTVDALTRVSDIIAAQTRQWDLLNRVCQFATTVLGARGASALVLDENGEHLTFAAALGPNSEHLLGQTLRVGEGIAGHVAQSGQVAIVHEAHGDSRFTPRIDRHIGFATRNVLCVPLRVRDRILGVIEVVNRENGANFSPADAEMLQAVANQAAVALDNARLYDRLSQRVEQSQDALAVANRQLQADKNLLQTVLHSMTDGVVVTDAQGRIQLFNPAAAELVPELRLGVEGETLADVLPDFPLAALPPVATPWGRSEPTILLRGDVDAPRSIEARAAPLKNPDGELAGVVAVFADVTQRRHIEQAKSDFVSFVAHEMRSPLTSISGFSAMLQKSENSTALGAAPLPVASRTRFLGLIREESERLTRLINNLLDVAKLEAGRAIELNRDRVDFAPLADMALESQRTYSSRHTLVRSFAELPPVYADADKVTQILINLLSNALKYSPGGVVTLSAQARDGWLEVSVRDQGPGIAPEQRGVLFSRFGRTPSASQGAGSRAKPTGTGLGLFLTKHLVETHGGRIWAESEPGHGATFRFTLPLAEE